METTKVNAAFLCNYEVMQILQQLKDSTQKKHKREGHLATVTYETVHYLQDTDCKNQSAQSIQKFLEAMKRYKLTKTEKLMMVNTPPRTELEIQLIVQESEERLSEDEEILVVEVIVPNINDMNLPADLNHYSVQELILSRNLPVSLNEDAYVDEILVVEVIVPNINDMNLPADLNHYSVQELILSRNLPVSLNEDAYVDV